MPALLLIKAKLGNSACAQEQTGLSTPSAQHFGTCTGGQVGQ